MLMRLQTILATTALSIALSACTQAPPKEKPLADPDVALDTKADILTDWYVDQVGFFELGSSEKFSIGYPTWFQGHLVELSAGQTIDFLVTSKDRSLVRLYGASYGTWGDEYLFERSIIASQTTPENEIYASRFTAEVENNGVYMLVVGPLSVWDTEYKFKADCVGGCDDEEVGSCEDDGDCSEGNWCACTEVGGCEDRACKPYAAEGESCGGHVPAHLATRCAPDHQCLGHGLAFDLPGVCAAVVTVPQLQANPELYDGRMITTEGYVEAPFAICTQQACSFENMCCNSCGAEQALFNTAGDAQSIEGVLLKKDDEAWRCGGSNCDWANNCTVNTGSYWLGGRFEVGQFGRMTLDIEDYYSVQ